MFSLWVQTAEVPALARERIEHTVTRSGPKHSRVSFTKKEDYAAARTVVHRVFSFDLLDDDLAAPVNG